jgi:hypothetical protein
MADDVEFEFEAALERRDKQLLAGPARDQASGGVL